MAKNPPANAGDIRDADLIPGSGRSPGGGHGNPLQCSCLENPMDRGAWLATIHRVTQSRTQLKRLSTHSGHGEGDLQTIEDKLSQGALWEEWGEAGQALTQPSAARGQIVRILRDYLCLKSISCPYFSWTERPIKPVPVRALYSSPINLKLSFDSIKFLTSFYFLL